MVTEVKWDNPTSLLKLDQVSKTYGQGETEVTALHPITLDVKEGEFIGIVGPSGSGKSTLLSIAGALLSPSKGNIYVSGQNITSLSEKEMTDIRLRKIGFIFQFANLVPFLTVKEQLLYIAKLKGEDKKEASKLAEQLLKTFGLVVELMKQEGKKNKKAAIMITHDEKMLDVCDRILTLRDGKLLRENEV